MLIAVVEKVHLKRRLKENLHDDYPDTELTLDCENAEIWRKAAFAVE